MSAQTTQNNNTKADAKTNNKSFLEKTPKQIREEVRNMAYEELKLKKNEIRPQGVLAGIVESMAHLASWLYSTFIFPLQKQISIDSATGSFLDAWGKTLGVTRYKGAKTRGHIQMEITRDVTITTKTAITVSGLGLVYYPVDNETNNGKIKFDSSKAVNGVYTESILVEAEKLGKEYNKPTAVSQATINPLITGLSKLSFKSNWIEDAKEKGRSGADPEGDENYRKRIQAQWMRAAAGNVPMLYEAEAQSIESVEEAKVFRSITSGNKPKDANSPQSGSPSSTGSAPNKNKAINPVGNQAVQYGVFRIVLRGPNDITREKVKTRFDEVGLIAHQHYIESVKLKKDLKIDCKYKSSSTTLSEQEAKERIKNYFLNLKIGQRYTMQDLYNLFDDMQDIQFTTPTASDGSLGEDEIYALNDNQIKAQSVAKS